VLKDVVCNVKKTKPIFMKKLLLLFILFIPFTIFSQELVPNELKPLFGTNESDELEISETQKIKTDLYRNYYVKSDPKGIYAIVFKLKNSQKFENFLLDQGFEKVYENTGGRFSNYHIIVYTTDKYEVIVDKKDKEATVYDFEKRAYRVVNDDFYGGVEVESLRSGFFQEAPLEPRIYLTFAPMNKSTLRAKINFTASDWIYSDTIKFSLENGAEILTYPLKEISNDVQNWRGYVEVEEISSFTLSPDDIQKIFDAKSVKVRLIGEKYYEFNLTTPQKYALSDFLTHY
jgi:hypothetical protein